ncbi:hypothetical protein NDU88_001071 [Pleurodeles waltl]|uniref:Uncharacterized protein n=1 Tax=Pleurodeles waltl TaxID=8319 RepID=A0AAV7V6S6_PLEWA|nr:hypothetical protein NDU88_001071 [Pleurodeles waltl]
MNVERGCPSSGDPDRTARADVGGCGRTTRQRKGKTHKPSEKESRKEREDLLHSLQHQESVSKTEADP